MAVYFSIFLVAITFITGAVWLADKFYLAPQRKLKLSEAQSQCQGELSAEASEAITQPSTLVDTAVQIFPVIAFVLILRSFLYEPFQIPSGSMMPTLLDGDFILVNKYNYGLRDPVVRNKFLEIGEPERGDVVVFKYPIEPTIDYIKRVIGLPGDTVIYQNKNIYLKKACPKDAKTCPDFIKVAEEKVSDGDYYEGLTPLSRYKEQLPNKEHEILINHAKPEFSNRFCSEANSNPCHQAGTRQNEFIVPEGYYFVMGDNRDNSLDSRFWGFVAEENLVGEAVFIWMSFDFERSPNDWLPTWIPTGVRFNRLGAIN